MRRKRSVTVSLAIIVTTASVLASCAPGPTPTPAATPTMVAAPASKAAWEVEWEKVLQTAREEGGVVIAGGSTTARLKDAGTKIFKEKFGIDLETITATGGEQRAKLKAERQRGIFYPDMLASGVSVHYDLKAEGFLDPMEPFFLLPEVLDTGKWLDKKLPWGDREKTTFIWAAFPNPLLAVNTNLVKPGEIRSYKDLLAPKWKGKIILNDPTVPGMGLGTTLTATLYNKMLDENYYRRLAREQDITVSRDLNLQVEWLARGKFPVLLHPSAGNVVKFIDAGAPVAWVELQEGTILAGGGSGLSVLNKAPHPNATKVFINWFLGREGQQLIQDATDKQSQRTDISTANLSSVRQPGVKYFEDPTNIEEFVRDEYPKYGELAKEIFGPLVK